MKKKVRKSKARNIKKNNIPDKPNLAMLADIDKKYLTIYLLSILLLVSAIIIIISTIFSNFEYENKDLIHSIKLGDTTENIEIQDINTRVVSFENSSLTDSQYSSLNEACQQYIENERLEYFDNHIDVDVTIDETLYIDNMISNQAVQDRGIDIGISLKLSSDSKNKYNNDIDSNYISTMNIEAYNIVSNEYSGSLIYTNQMSKADVIYFDNILMERYMDNDGLMKIIFSAFDEGEPIIIRQQELAYNAKSAIDLSEFRLPNSDIMSEKEFIADISFNIVSLIKKNTDEIDNKDFGNIFTIDGKSIMLGISKSIKDEIKNEFDTEDMEKININMEYAMAGKSPDLDDTDKKDRIYIRYRVDDGNSEDYFNIVVKLTPELSIFDIDLV